MQEPRARRGIRWLAWMASPALSRLMAAVVALGAALGLASWQEASAAATRRFAIVFATGGLGDKSFNDSAYEGMKMAEQRFGVKFDYAEPTAISQYETFLNQFARSRRYDLIISIGFDQADAVRAVARRYPDQRFAIVDTVVEGLPNVASYAYKEPERGFLLGVISALMTTRTDDPKINPQRVVGVVGGMDIPLINANIAGFMAGAKYADPRTQVLYSYVGSWADPARGKELALAQREKGADIIWAAAGRSGLGVLKAAEENGFYALGADSDQGWVAPGHVLTNGLKLVNNTVVYAVEQVLNGKFEGKVHILGVAEKALGYNKGLVPDDIARVADQLAARIASGELVPPSEIGQVDAWLARAGTLKQ